jgi:hypothetical protein
MAKLQKLKNNIINSNNISWYKPGKKVTTRDAMASYSSYTYELTARYGRDFRSDFKPEYTPAEMLSAGVFEGKYLNDMWYEFPREWYSNAIKLNKLSPDIANPTINKFGIKSRKNIDYWINAGWIPITQSHNVNNVVKKLLAKQPEEYKTLSNFSIRDTTDFDIRGWFLWYCRYYLGRRQPIIDDIQINRWKSFARHKSQYMLHCDGVKKCRLRQAQALLQWAYKV